MTKMQIFKENAGSHSRVAVFPLKAHVFEGKVGKVIFGEPLGFVEVRDYKDNFDSQVFKSRIDPLNELIMNSRTGEIVLADEEFPVRYGAGCVNILHEPKKERNIVIFPKRTETAPRMPFVLDTAAGLGDDVSVLKTALNEGIEEIIHYANAKAGSSKFTVVLVPMFDQSPYNQYNPNALQKICDITSALQLPLPATIFCVAKPVILNNNTIIETTDSQFNASIAFELQSIEVVIAKKIILPEQLPFENLVSHDAEFIGSPGQPKTPLNRQSVAIDPATGETWAFQNGDIKYQGTLKRYLQENVDTTKTGGKYATVKVESIIRNWDKNSLGDNTGLLPLLGEK